VNSFIFYDSPSEEDRKNNRFDVEGYITRDWLKEKVSLEEADFYFCGPVPFMKAINRSLKELGVTEDRIHFEFFGPMGNLEE
jgi:nitric oxide dioxygenase